jgi:hypothetical protein
MLRHPPGIFEGFAIGAAPMTNLPRRRWYQFGLETLFVVIAIAAVALWGGSEFLDWYYYVPLSNQIASFNSRAMISPVGRHEPPLTEDEVINSIRSHLPGLDASEQVKGILRHIAKTHRLPQGATLSGIPGCSNQNGIYTVWWINLEFMTSATSGYGLRIRETNNPVAARANGTGMPEKASSTPVPNASATPAK